MQLLNETVLKKHIGKVLYEKRKSLSLSQEDLAENIGVQARTIGNLENGRIFISSKVLCRLCNFFNLTPDFFFSINNIDNDIDSKMKNEIINKLDACNNKRLKLYYKILNAIDSEYDE